MSNIACAVFSFDRPLYLKKSLESIYQSWIKSNADIVFYLFQDGQSVDGIQYATNEDFNETKEILYEYKEKFEFAEVIETANNIGIGKQKHRAHQLFNNYDNIIFFEDDMIVSPYYINILLSMSGQFPDYVVQACDRTGGLPNDEFKNHLDEVIESGCHWWGYLMPRSVFKKVNSVLEHYVNIIGDNYRKRPHKLIKDTFKVGASSHDAILSKAMKESNQKKITTKVPRAKYIGRQGLHASPAWYKKFNFHIEKQYVFHQDSKLEAFKLI